MSANLVVLAILMLAVTYPTRAVGLLTPGLDRLPRIALTYLQLVGPAVLAALAAVSVMVVVGSTDKPAFHVGIEWVAVLACLVVVARRRNLLLGLVVAVAIVAIARAAGLAAAGLTDALAVPGRVRPAGPPPRSRPAGSGR